MKMQRELVAGGLTALVVLGLLSMRQGGPTAEDKAKTDPADPASKAALDLIKQVETALGANASAAQWNGAAMQLELAAAAPGATQAQKDILLAAAKRLRENAAKAAT